MGDRGTGPSGDPFQASLEFIARVDEEVAAERVALPFGIGIFDSDRPHVWDSNYVRVRREGAALGGAALAELVEPLFADRRLRHRQIVAPALDDPAGLQSELETIGWSPAHELIMVLGSRPEAPVHPVKEISFTDLRGPVRDVELMEPPRVADPAIVPVLVGQLAGRDELVAAVTAERRFVVEADGAPVAWCRLYSGDGIGQVEQVMTHPAHRNRGYARAVVSAAAAASHDRGDELTFLVAEAEDWPQQLYRRLGFETVGEVARFRKIPPGVTRA